MKIAVFWVVAPCSLVEVYQRFRGPCCLHHQGDEYPWLSVCHNGKPIGRSPIQGFLLLGLRINSEAGQTNGQFIQYSAWLRAGRNRQFIQYSAWLRAGRDRPMDSSSSTVPGYVLGGTDKWTVHPVQCLATCWAEQTNRQFIKYSSWIRAEQPGFHSRHGQGVFSSPALYPDRLWCPLSLLSNGNRGNKQVYLIHVRRKVFHSLSGIKFSF
jgi:hypothetical protein